MMDDLLLDFETKLKLSALSKANKINALVNEVTIGPNCSRNLRDKKTVTKTIIRQEKDDHEVTSEITENGLPIRHILKELEMRRQEEVKDAIQARLSIIEEFSNKQEVSKKQQWLRQQQAFIEDMQEKESSIFQALNEFDKNTSNEHARLVQYYQDIAERRKIHEKELEAREKQRQTINTNIDAIKKHQVEFRTVYQQIIPMLRECSGNDLKNSLGEDVKLLHLLPEHLEEVIKNCRLGKVTEQEVQEASTIVNQVRVFKEQIEKALAEIINNKKEVPVLEHHSIPQASSLISGGDDYKQKRNVDQTKKISDSNALSLTQYVSMTNLKMYTEIIEYLENHTATFKDLEMDTSQKHFKFECKKAINTPVNSLSGINAEHILDKYNRLYKLLSGQNVSVSEKQINASIHPQGIAFCMDLLAKKFVLQGDLMVSSNPESAFCYATVMVSLWNDFPTFGKLVLAYFYKFCPYLVPYYVPRQVGESDEEFYTKQGYQYNNGLIEKQDKFLKRMTGITRLYAAVLIARPKKGQSNTPHNIQHGWRWLSSTLHLEPRVDVTATVVHTFLETVGFEMETRYGRVFTKLTRMIIEKFLPRCKEKCTGGAGIRLELLLSEYVKNKKFEQPNGYLSYSYW